MRKRMHKSLSFRVFLWVFLALAICSAIIYGIVMKVVPERYKFATDSQLEENTNVFFEQLENSTYEDAVKEIYNFCIANNSTACLSCENETLSFGEIDANKNNIVTSNYATKLTFRDDTSDYTLIISSISQTPNELSSLFLRFIPVIIVIIILISIFSALICSRVIVKPILNICHIAKRMTQLDMTWRCDADGTDEIGELAKSLNTMANELQSTMGQLENANEQLREDVERFKTLGEQRKNFFAAVSHELKTPITILKGQIENMMLGYGDYKHHEKYLPQALATTDEIEYLVKEILSISKMEAMNLVDSLKDVSLKLMIEQTIKEVHPLANEKKITINHKIKEEIIINVNPNLFSKALSNILGNAIRYSPKGEQVFIGVERNEKNLILNIENTGVNIPNEALSNMFTPFYRTDHSRSKSTGGTGLGLYIVKTIADLHEMKYSISNTKRGVIFSLKLNQRYIKN